MFVTPLHRPVHLAKSLSTLDQLSRGILLTPLLEEIAQMERLAADVIPRMLE